MSQSNPNPLGQPVGLALDGWNAPPPPSRSSLVGRHCRVEPLDPARLAEDLYEATAADVEGRIWTYLSYGPFGSRADLRSWTEAATEREDRLFFAIVDEADGRAAGVASYLRINPAVGSIEVGNICYPPRLQRTTAATEAMVLMMRNAFELGYRRYEWKCDRLNAASIAAAERLGFTFEGVFRQATIFRGRNRDTAWFAIIDRDWEELRSCYERWLAQGNFDADGVQRKSLSTLTAPVVRRRFASW
ncbi:MAG: GNAT family N-acetyltransferase [Holophagales bacterium]|nr:GNAT family N-acetyltransferase [Holophagales bacterium]MYD21894.1 GNAT family N-acetyltransferase [Holophagales bacterium]MYI31909.1 GNAT family N-acetyltransferase [Holophagales bacterium]